METLFTEIANDLLKVAPSGSVAVIVMFNELIESKSKDTPSFNFKTPSFVISRREASVPLRVKVTESESTSVKETVPISAPAEFSSTVKTVIVMSVGASFTAVTTKV